uniref:Polyprotein protein n=1 Tax=Solanum tuberosum TaxID=4113 RepID=M1DM71_SOLTU
MTPMAMNHGTLIDSRTVVLITELCKHARVPRYTTMDIEVTPSSSSDIRCIKAEFKREEVDSRRAAPADIFLKVDVDSLPAEAPSPTPASEPSEQKGGDIRGSALEANVEDLRKDVDYLRSIDFTSLIRGAHGEDAPETSGIPLATIGDVQTGGTTYEESVVETDKEMMESR